MKKILVVGSVALDTIRTPQVKGDYILGGSAVHFVNASAILGVPVDLVGVVGEDFKSEYKEFLIKKKANISGLLSKPGKTFHWEGYYENDMNQAYTVKTELNVFENFQPHIPDSYKNDPFVFLANIDPVLQLNVLDNMNSPEFVVSDTMNLWIETKKKDLEKVISRSNIIFFNEAEIRQYTGIMNIVKAARKVIETGPSFVIVKRGEYGFLLAGKDELFCAPGMIVEQVVDPTGAGDSFAGGFMSYLSVKERLNFKNFCKAAVYANLVASFNVEGLGIERLNNITFKDVKIRFQKYKKFIKGYDL